MRIAIQAADLDAARIDGTRVYIINCLKYFGKLDPNSDFLIYHKNSFNPQMIPPQFPNYRIIGKFWPCLWTQTRFAFSVFCTKADILWMPLHNIPLLRNKKTKTVVTIHDLAFKYFPETFPKVELFKINLLTKLAVDNSDKIITISQSSKNDILKFYPEVEPEKIEIIYHGYDEEVFYDRRDEVAEEKVKKEFGIKGDYILYTGGFHPKKNLEVLIESFNTVKKDHPEMKLVLVGEKAWMWKDFYKKLEESPYRQDIIFTGRVKFNELGHLYRAAKIYVYPSLYDGFGITILEGMASGVPVISAHNSSLPEVGGEACLYFESNNSEDLAEKIGKVLSDQNLAGDMIKKGLEQARKFSWERCAKETLDVFGNLSHSSDAALKRK
jgi:glycosyltransferase involved in cell wall biosynthesis